MTNGTEAGRIAGGGAWRCAMQVGFGPALVAIESGAATARDRRLEPAHSARGVLPAAGNPPLAGSARPYRRRRQAGRSHAPIDLRGAAQARRRPDRTHLRADRQQRHDIPALLAGDVDAGFGETDVFENQAHYGVHALDDGVLWRELPEFPNQASFATETAISGSARGWSHPGGSCAALRFLQRSGIRGTNMRRHGPRRCRNRPQRRDGRSGRSTSGTILSPANLQLPESSAWLPAGDQCGHGFAASRPALRGRHRCPARDALQRSMAATRWSDADAVQSTSAADSCSHAHSEGRACDAAACPGRQRLRMDRGRESLVRGSRSLCRRRLFAHRHRRCLLEVGAGNSGGESEAIIGRWLQEPGQAQLRCCLRRK